MRRLGAACVLVAALAFAASARAQDNLVVNGDFATDLAGWDDIDVETWSPTDVAEDPESGSIQIPNASGPQSGVYAQQCIPVDPGETYTFGASSFASGDEVTGEARIDLRFWTSANCSTGDLTLHRLADDTIGEWIDQEDSAVAPQNAQSASLSLVAFKLTGNLFLPFTVNFDDAHVVVPEPAASAAALAALAALASVRSHRRR
jgi:hypothetical protein